MDRESVFAIIELSGRIIIAFVMMFVLSSFKVPGMIIGLVEVVMVFWALIPITNHKDFNPEA